MKIYLVGGGSGGHFFPIIAVSRSLRKISIEEKIVDINLIYAAPEPYNKNLLLQEGIEYRYVPAGKQRRYFSLLNFIDMFKTGFGFLIAILRVFMDFPDVVFSKGGYASFPVLLAARIFGIPVMIHESDLVPGKVNSWAAKFARRIAISYAESLKYFPEEKSALTGNPIREEILGGSKEEAEAIFELESGLPTILILGGSQGSRKINDIILDAMPDLIQNYQIIHQTGVKNFDEVKKRADYILENNKYKPRYHVYDFLNEGMLRSAGFAADLVIARAGSNIFEIAAWQKPSILIPLAGSAQNHQRENAYAYARTGACQVIEEDNFTSHLLMFEINKIINDNGLKKRMAESAASFSRIDAADKIAREILTLAIEHSK